MGVLIFFIGVLCGAFLGTVFMCCLQVGAESERKYEILEAQRGKQ